MKKICLSICLIASFYTYIQAQTLYVSGTGSLYVKGTANINGNISSAPTLYVTGSIQNNGTLTNAGEMQQTGNFDNPGTFSSTGDNVFLLGATQNLSGAFTGSESFYNLIVNKTVNSVVLSVNVEVANQVNLVNGKISIGNLSLILAPTATITGYDANDYILTGSTGTLRQTVGASNVVFPVGISSYNPLTMSNAGTTDVFSVRVQDQVICQGNNPLATTAKVNRRWNMTEAVLGGSDATISVQWNTAEEDATFDRNLSGITTYDSSVPTYMLSATNTAAANPSAGVYTQTKSGQTLIGHVTVTSVPQTSTSGATTFCNGGNVTLTSPTDALYTYQWQNGGTNISGANSSTYMADATGTYSSVITVNGTCTMTTSPISVTEQAPVPTPTIAFTNPASANDSLTLCTGNLVTMSCPTNPVYEYLWYRNGVLVNYQVSPNNIYTVNTSIAGVDVYTLAITLPNETCLSAQSAPLTIVKSAPNPIVTAIGPTTFCLNTPSTLTTGTGMATYVWRRAGTIVSTGTNTYIPVASGNHNVTVTDINGCSKASAWLPITVKALPSANAGPDKTLCIGTPVSIGSTGVAGNTYTWSPATDLTTPYLSTTNTNTTTTTTYTLTVYNTTSGCTNTDNVVVTAVAPPATPSLTSTATPVCQGASVVITPTTVGATSVNWYRNGTLLYNKPTSFVLSTNTITASGELFTIINRNASGCLSASSNAINAWVKEAAVPTITSTPAAVGTTITVCVPGGTSGSATLTASSTTASPAYSWLVGGALVSGANTNTYTQVVTTTANNRIVSVQATYPNGCVKTSTTRLVKLVTTGCTPKLSEDKDGDMLISTENTDIKLYPNPAQSMINLSIEANQSKVAKLTLYNELGQTVFSQSTALTEGINDIQIDISHFAIGIYTLSLDTDDMHHIEKVVKE